MFVHDASNSNTIDLGPVVLLIDQSYHTYPCTSYYDNYHRQGPLCIESGNFILKSYEWLAQGCHDYKD